MIELRHGDCLEEMKTIPDRSIDLILCDLPYGTTNCAWDVVIPFDALWPQYNRIIKDRGAVLLFSQQPFSAQLITTNKKYFRYEWIWKKEQGTGFLNAKKMPLKAHENILVFYKKLPTYNPQWWYGKPYKNKISRSGGAVYGKHEMHASASKDGKRYPIDIIEFSTDKSKKARGLHPTQKPVALLEYFINTYTNEGDLVLDNCMGSGSTGVACINTNRRFIGIEKDAHYFNIAKNRIGEKQNERKY